MTEIQSQRETVSQLIALYRNNDRLHHQAIERAVQTAGIGGSDHRMIGYLYHHQNRAKNQCDIARELRISTAAVAVCLAKLEKGGLIARSASHTDRRNNTIHLTEKGLAVAKRTERVFRDVDLKMLHGFSAEEIVLFFRCLEKINGNLKKILSENQEENP